MSVHPNQNQSNDPKRIRSPATWIMGLMFLIALVGVLFLYDGRDQQTTGTAPNVMNNPGVSR